MTTLEIQANTTPAFVMPELSAVPGKVIIAGTITDCPAYAWANAKHQLATYDLRERFGFQWVSDWREDLDAAAHDLMRDYLLAEWRGRGFEPQFTDDTAAYEEEARTPSTTDPSDATYWEVWDAAADRITADELIDKANLREYAR